MRPNFRLALLALSLVALAATGWSQQRKSPHESTSATIGKAEIEITYGRPYKKGREIFGGLEPYGKVWRTGADEATTFETSSDLMVGDIHVPAGKYSLFTIPDGDKWTLVLNETAEQWGAFKYDQGQDLGRTPMTVKTLNAPVEQLTIEIKPSGDKGVLSVTWDRASASVEIMAH